MAEPAGVAILHALEQVQQGAQVVQGSAELAADTELMANIPLVTASQTQAAAVEVEPFVTAPTFSVEAAAAAL